MAGGGGGGGWGGVGKQPSVQERRNGECPSGLTANGNYDRNFSTFFCVPPDWRGGVAWCALRPYFVIFVLYV
jgi:hypothetical protein